MPAFQVVPPCGGHPIRITMLINSTAFQVVPPCGGHHLRNRKLILVKRFQVVPPCGGHLVDGTPANGCIKSFKSCPRVGGIFLNVAFCFLDWSVSSRAPVWGASVSGIPQPKGTTSFQVVPPCGGHLAAGRSACRRTRFQVVPPCGGHPNEAIMLRLNTEFQVVPPCGGHPAVHVHLAGHLRVSSRAPVWGASCAGASLRPCCCFKSCPRVGGIRRRALRSGQ